MIATARQYRLGQVPEDYNLTVFGQQLLDAATVYANYETAQKCLDLNLTRAQQGLPPVDCAAYGTGVQIGVASGTQNMVYIVLAVLAGAYLLPKLLK